MLDDDLRPRYAEQIGQQTYNRRVRVAIGWGCFYFDFERIAEPATDDINGGTRNDLYHEYHVMLRCTESNWAVVEETLD